MPITDNLIVKVQPAAGDTFVKNLIDNSDCAANGAGTLALQNDAGLYGWQVQGARTGAFAGGSHYDGGAITVALRFKVNSRAADFATYFQCGTAESGSIFGANITNNGSVTGALRLREAIAGGGFTVIGTPAYTTADYFTVVLRLRDNGYNGGTLDAFLKQAARTSNNPDHSVSAASMVRSAQGVVDALQLGAASQNLTFFDIAVWMRDLTDAEAAAVADDIRGQLVSGTVINASVGDAVADGLTAAIINGTTVNANVGNAVADGLTANITNTNGTTINCDVGNAVASGLTANISNGTTINASVGNAVADGLTATIIAPIVAAASFTSEPIMNNTETASLANIAVVWTWTANGRIGSMSGKTVTDGTGTTGADGSLTVMGIPAGAGKLDIAVLGATPSQDAVFTQFGTAA